MTCLYCPHKIQTRESGLCAMHLGRLRRNGHPLLKRRARGVMDGPVLTYVEERKRGEWRKPYEKREKPIQSTVLAVLARAGGDPVAPAVLIDRTGSSKTAIEQAVYNLRRRFGKATIKTQYRPRQVGAEGFGIVGYSIPADVLARVLGGTK